MTAFIIIAILAFAAIALTFAREVGKLNDLVDELFHKVVEQTGETCTIKEKMVEHDAQFKHYDSEIESLKERERIVPVEVPVNRCSYPEEIKKAAIDFIVSEYGRMTITEIARLLNIPRSTVNDWTRKLIKDGKIPAVASEETK